jgi:cyclophilin family peptidyl-prolyl cis-trans isomerase
MPSRKRKSKKKQAAQTETVIRYAAIVVVVIVVALLVWRVVGGNASKSADEPQTAVEEIDDLSDLFDVEVVPEDEDLDVTPIPVDVVPEVRQYDAPPPMMIDAERKYYATFEMEKGGTFVVELYADKAPITVNSFVFLAREGYFDGVTFHRVLEGFMAQGGDPTGTGMGGPGYKFQNEDSDLTFDKPGVLAMANAGRDTNGSQFFITFVPTPQLNGGYTIFGQVVEGMDVVNGITRRDPNMNPNFTGDVIASITITEE